MTNRQTLFPIVAADVALFAVMSGTLRVLLFERVNEPQAGLYALPGAILDPARDASIDDTARRALTSRLEGVQGIYLEQVGVFSGADRDPRGYSVSVGYFALLPLDHAVAVSTLDGGRMKGQLMPEPTCLPKTVAFDHSVIISRAAARLNEKVERLSLPLHLLPSTFTLTQLQAVCEAVLGKKLEKSSFRRRLRGENNLVPLRSKFAKGPYRPAQLYRARSRFRF